MLENVTDVEVEMDLENLRVVRETLGSVCGCGGVGGMVTSSTGGGSLNFLRASSKSAWMFMRIF